MRRVAVGQEERSVLADASGRRARRLRLVARGASLLLLLWLLTIVLGGFGLNPAGRLPLGSVLRASHGPPRLEALPAPTPPAAADLRPALPAAAAPALPAHRTRAFAPANGRVATSRGKSALSPGHRKRHAGATTATTAHGQGKAAVAPGHTSRTTATTTTHGASARAPGHLKHR